MSLSRSSGYSFWPFSALAGRGSGEGVPPIRVGRTSNCCGISREPPGRWSPRVRWADARPRSPGLRMKSRRFRAPDGFVIICPEPSLRLRSMDTVPAGAVRRSEGGEVAMELPLVRATNRRFQMWIPLLLAFGFVLVAAVPLAAGGGDQPLAASMLVSRTQASPGDNVTFWIWITPLKEKA